MKVPYKYFINSLKDKPSLEDLSSKLFQLGHEHEIENNILSNVSLNRFGTSKEIAWMYLSLISPNNSFMTGSNIIIDGQQVKKIF